MVVLVCGCAGKVAGPPLPRRRVPFPPVSVASKGDVVDTETPAMADRPDPSILFVDDDETSRRAFSWLLRAARFRPSEAATGTEALRLAAEKPDLIVLDVNLPDIDGFEVCRRIKAHPATSAIPVLHMSGVFTSTLDRTHALEGGADGYLTKP